VRDESAPGRDRGKGEEGCFRGSGLTSAEERARRGALGAQD